MRTLTKRLAVLFALSSALTLGLVHCSDDDATPDPTPTNEAGTDSNTGTDSNVPPVDGSVEASVDAAPLLRGALDRVGRPAAIFMMIDPASRHAWNKEGSLNPTSGLYEAQIQNNLVAMDQLDTTQAFDASTVPPEAGPPDGGTLLTHPLGRMMFRDMLIVDATLPFSETSYLDIENQVYLAGATHTTCGGRWPGEDAIDKQLSILVKGALTGVTDGVAAPTKAPTKTFPYLAEPN